MGAQGVTGNAAKAGLKNGDQIIYHSSFFGDELWPVRPDCHTGLSLTTRLESSRSRLPGGP